MIDCSNPSQLMLHKQPAAMYQALLTEGQERAGPRKLPWLYPKWESFWGLQQKLLVVGECSEQFPVQSTYLKSRALSTQHKSEFWVLLIPYFSQILLEGYRKLKLQSPRAADAQQEWTITTAWPPPATASSPWTLLPWPSAEVLDWRNHRGDEKSNLVDVSLY